MDTDHLSNETYQAIIITAEKFNHNLTLKFGMLSYKCKDEKEYLEKATRLIKYWKSETRDSIDDIFFDTEKPTITAFKKVLSAIQHNIKVVTSIPPEKRTFDF